MRLNMLLSRVRRTLGIPGYWSLSGYAKRKVKSAVDFVFGVEDDVARHATARGVDGVICGHIHAAAIRCVAGITYVNCGDWLDSCSAVVEHDDGRMALVNWGVRARAEAPPSDPALLEPVTGHSGPRLPFREPA